LVAEVEEDTDSSEPDWFDFLGREEHEKILPKKYWTKLSANTGVQVLLGNLRYHIEKLEEEQQATAHGGVLSWLLILSLILMVKLIAWVWISLL
jgi:hypothetical protein